MNYYEELGIPATASAEEVRRAYRNLARLLHPDQQSEETLRHLAGIQMTRLNEILRTLTDPNLRAEYDDSLRRHAGGRAAAGERMWAERADAEESTVPFRRGMRWSRLAWPGAGAVGIALIVLFLAQDAAVQRPGNESEGAASAGERQEKGAGAWPARTEGRVARPRKAQGDAERPGNDEGEVAGDGVNPSPPDTAHATDFGGAWYYARPPKLADADGMCPPVYIDMEVSEARGQLTGKYSARYAVGERPISPFVEFHFAGAVREPAADLAWSGPGGAAGRVRLTLVSPRWMRVEWSADKVGEEMGLGSGVATLVRRGPR
jgi:curved DNA-binding protein CbpA